MMRFIVFFIALCSATQLIAQEWLIDTTVIRIGEPIRVQFSAEVESDTVSFPNYDSWWNAGFELIEVDSAIILKKNGRFQMQQHLWITSFDTGFAVLEPIYFQFGEQTFSSEPTMIEVQWVMIEEGIELFDIKDSITIPRPWYFYALWVLGILLFIAGIYFLWIFFKKRTTYHPPVIQIEKTPIEIAFEKINNLRQSSLWEEEKYGLFFLELTTILRQYLDKTYSTKVMESTLTELKRAVDGLPVRETVIGELHHFFEHAEMVKYAKVLPSRSNSEAYLAQVEKLIEVLEPQTHTNQSHV